MKLFNIVELDSCTIKHVP